MLKRIFKSQFIKETSWAIGGQVAFLLSNFILFVLLINDLPTSQYGIWALFITAISITDSIRQGLVQNGLSRMIIEKPNDQAIKVSGLLINKVFIILAGGFLVLYATYFPATSGLSELLQQGWKSLLVLGTIQLIATFCQAKRDFKTYFIVNLLYLIGFGALLYQLSSQGSLSNLSSVIDRQLWALIVPVLFYLFKTKPKWSKPTKEHIMGLLSFGKYVSGTNLLSMIFHKADILMVAYFLDPVSVAVFHFATKIMNYAELPLHALSQVIYPRISASYRSKTSNQLNTEYGLAILRLLIFVIPICWVLMTFNKQIISLLSTDEYIPASQLIIILSFGMMFKPIGRVFGLTLDAIGKPDINFKMLLLSVILNLGMNLILIPKFGITGAAIATSFSIITTILIGQFAISKHTIIRPLRDVKHSIGLFANKMNIQSWN